MNPDNSTSSLKYQDAHRRVIEDAAAIEVYGLTLDTNEETGSERSPERWAGFLPITWCVCFHDSPENPCPCNGPIIWIPRDMIIRIEQSGRRSQEGLSVSRFLVRREANLIVEQALRMPVEVFVKRYGSPPVPTHFPGAVPNDRPGPPINAGLVIPAPSQTTHDSGILWYAVQATPETRTVNVVAFNTGGKEVARHLTQMMSDNEARFAISHRETSIVGGIVLNRHRDGGLEIKGHVDGQEFVISSRAGGAECGEVSGQLSLDVAKLQILNQWGRIAQPLMTLAEATDGGQAKKSCLGCVVLLAGITVGAGCCPFNPACCAAGLIGGSSFWDNCQGACA